MSDTSNNNYSLHTSNGIFEAWSEFISNEDNDVEMGEADDGLHDDPSNVTIQSIHNTFSNWSHRYRYIPLINNFIMPNNLDTVGRTVTRSFDEDSPKYKNVLSSAGKSIIKFINFNTEKFPDQLLCPITQEKFEKDQNIALLPCGHIFEKDAVMKWLENENASCPSCRFKLDSVEEEKDPISRFSITNLLNYIDRREQEREDEDVQRAIMASLKDISGADF